MEIITALSVFVLGTIVGSFLNVVIIRYNTGFSLDGRSQCLSCGIKLTWRDLIPIFSFIYRKGRCVICRSHVSWQYPFVELVTGLLFLGIHILSFNGIFDLLYAIDIGYYAMVMSLFVIIGVYDFKHKIIPDPFVFAFIMIAFVGSWFFADLSIGVQVLTGIVAAIPFAFLWLISRGRWMGLGDAKLALGLGLFLPPQEVFSGLVLAFWIGAIFGLGVLALRLLLRSYRALFPRLYAYTIKSEIPFAPFMIVGTLIVFFFGFDVLELLYIL